MFPLLGKIATFPILMWMMLSGQCASMSDPLSPPEHFVRVGNPRYTRQGRALLREGKLGCLILAGGLGSRLGHEGPKGTYPITPIRKKSLFQLFAEKIRAAENRYQTTIPLAVMTSPQNHEETIRFFETHNYFGLKKENLFFFSQHELPLLDEKRYPLSVKAPDGNGYALRYF